MDPVVISGSNFRADMIALRDDLDKNGKCFPGLRAMISAKHQEAQAQAYHQFREDELDLFDKDEIILREKSYIEKKSVSTFYLIFCATFYLINRRILYLDYDVANTYHNFG
jgi:hypothetical protein